MSSAIDKTTPTITYEVLRDENDERSPIKLGTRLAIKDQNCTIRYVGELEGTGKQWMGVEWDDDTKGKHDGSYKGKRIFKCLSPSPTAASFVRSLKEKDVQRGRDFSEAVRAKYASDTLPNPTPLAPVSTNPIVISGKVAEEIGFEKIKEQQARLNELRHVLLPGEKIRHVSENLEEDIWEAFSQIVDLDLRDNLFQSFDDIEVICRGLTKLRNLRLDANRFEGLITGNDCQTPGTTRTFKNITELSFDSSYLPWSSVSWVRDLFPSLHTLSISSNYLKSITLPIQDGNLRSLALEYNDFHSLSDIEPLSSLQNLETLSLKGNKISSISPPDSPPNTFQFGEKLHYMDLSYNLISTWSFIDSLKPLFPSLTKLRISSNPLYPSTTHNAPPNSDELFMEAVARIPGLLALNFTPITLRQRENAEMFYLYLVAKEIAKVPEGDEEKVTAQHKRWKELCELHGKPDVVRVEKGSVDPAWLEARLITFTFYLTQEGGKEKEIKREIPRSWDTYRVKGVVGKALGLKPMRLKLIWETGEWDPVAGFEELDEDEGESDDEGDGLEVRDREEEGEEEGKKKGKWMKREVELVDGTRQVGFTIDGMEARVRVELR